MADWPLWGTRGVETSAVSASTSEGTVVTASGSTNVKGLWTELIASTTFNSIGFLTTIASGSGAAQWLVDIGIGLTNEERVIVPDLHVAAGRAEQVGASLFIPVYIPKSSRVSARCQSSVANANISVCLNFMSESFVTPQPCSAVEAYGADLTDSGGTSIDPGGTLNTKPSTWTQLIASTSRTALFMFLCIGNRANGTMTTANWLLDIGFGPAGSERLILSNIHCSANTTSDTLSIQGIGAVPVFVPKNTRVSARAQCSITDATDRLIDVVAYGVSA